MASVIFLELYHATRISFFGDSVSILTNLELGFLCQKLNVQLHF